MIATLILNKWTFQEFPLPNPINRSLAKLSAPVRIRPSLGKDRGAKLPAYARNSIPEYWILNLMDNQLEVYREPSGEDYRDTRILRVGDEVSPLAAPSATIRVANLLP